MVSSLQPVRIDAEGPSVPACPIEGADLSDATALVESERMGSFDWTDRSRSFRKNWSCRSMRLVGHASPGSCGPPGPTLTVVVTTRTELQGHTRRKPGPTIRAS